MIIKKATNSEGPKPQNTQGMPRSRTAKTGKSFFCRVRKAKENVSSQSAKNSEFDITF